jgi:septal ring factor EnvC (AmiA/AmiB activator)
VTPTVPEPITLPVTPTVPDPLVPELRARINDLEVRLRATQDEMLAMAQKVGATESEMIALQAQAIEIRSDRDAWRQQAERLAASAERRPWWRRLAG